MPKRIPHLETTILDQAAALFSQHGYDAVDMKMVAAACSTSVGNLYNYHRSKPSLFLAIQDRWKQGLSGMFQEILAEELPRREKILRLLGKIYDDVSGWQGVWKEFLQGPKERSELIESKAKKGKGHPWGLGPDELVILADFESLLTGQASPDSVSRWAYLTLMATIQLAVRFPEHRNENWIFLETLVDKL